MATIQRFEELEVWQKAREFYQDIVRITQYTAFSKDFELKNQLKASSGSVMDNIAEGYERDGKKEFVQFLSIAKGSCGESRSQLYRALDNAYISNEEFEILRLKTENISKSLSGFIGYLRRSEMTGTKYK
ncbi:four helix bundle protein [Bacteroidia bacterium]|nr:four helix bundle protein [Bacteroidia bacterium]